VLECLATFIFSLCKVESQHLFFISEEEQSSLLYFNYLLPFAIIVAKLLLLSSCTNLSKAAHIH